VSKILASVLAVTFTFAILTARAAEEVAPIAKSMKTLDGLYAASFEMASFRSERVSIGPDGRVTLQMPTGFEARGWVDGKITYFSPAGFVVKFNGMKGPFEMRFVFQKGYPKSIFREDGGGAISVFTKR
jgi:hypothetical protein